MFLLQQPILHAKRRHINYKWVLHSLYILAEIYKDNFESVVLKSKNKLVDIVFWARYVDDMFCIWTWSCFLHKLLHIPLKKYFENELNVIKTTSI